MFQIGSSSILKWLTSYRFAAVKMGLKAMSVASKVSVRTDGEGVLSMNFMIDIDGKVIFVEFRVFSLNTLFLT